MSSFISRRVGGAPAVSDHHRSGMRAQPLDALTHSGSLAHLLHAHQVSGRSSRRSRPPGHRNPCLVHFIGLLLAQIPGYP